MSDRATYRRRSHRVAPRCPSGVGVTVDIQHVEHVPWGQARIAGYMLPGRGAATASPRGRYGHRASTPRDRPRSPGAYLGAPAWAPWKSSPKIRTVPTTHEAWHPAAGTGTPPPARPGPRPSRTPATSTAPLTLGRRRAFPPGGPTRPAGTASRRSRPAPSPPGAGAPGTTELRPGPQLRDRRLDRPGPGCPTAGRQAWRFLHLTSTPRTYRFHPRALPPGRGLGMQDQAAKATCTAGDRDQDHGSLIP